ncbi:MAG: PD40 domain-containing protein [Sphingobacteriaceae bacterium]|nr:PD40 domain-containing protein [Sphingobacteriaceae bacterium]
MKTYSKVLLCLTFTFIAINGFSQINAFVIDETEKTISKNHIALFNKAKLSFETELYLEALPNLDSLLKLYPDNVPVIYLTGICKTYDEENKAKAVTLLLKVEKQKAQLEYYNYNLAYAYEQIDSSRLADKYFSTFITEESTKPQPNKALIEQATRRIANLKMLDAMKTKINIVQIKNIGPPVNTDASEYVALIPSDESFMVYTYRGKLSKGGKQNLKKTKMEGPSKKEEGIFFEDVFTSNRVNDSAWSAPKPIININTMLHDAAVTLSADGTQLIIYKNTGTGNGDLYLSKLEGKTWSVPKYQKGLNSESWDGSACFLPDKKHMIISSERKGGFGGRDLYTAEKLGDDLWGNITNMGKEINTEYNEDAPFITADGKILFYSTDGKLSSGGYDIVRSDLKNGTWSTPYNLGKPINTDNDDKFFIVTGDGKRGYYSTFQKGGKGEQDIYSIEPGIPGKPIALVQVTGSVTINNKPAEAAIEIKSIINSKFKSQKINSNSASGKFLINLPSGDEYELIFTSANFATQTKTVHTVGIDSFIQINVIADFYDDAYTKGLQAKSDSLSKANIVLNEGFSSNDFSAKFGNTVVDGLVYQIQIGAFKFQENFNYTYILGYGKIQRNKYEDGITRFTVGSYTKFNEVLKHLNEIQTDAMKDAFIIAIYKGKKYYLSELVKSGIIK